ncbi:hypothetical protein [Kitasatospora viridis]|uniref:Uncharacterized protein n=1 Tax=Kitasatospora viridis TaxID=281105 RepID=A0A561SA96_9ACTN|nr:hypothetical protein [Kitasatospora viridis]TWF71725.1 hypothetical protein FHX73_1896 [Kitasatospora viridis]
MPAMPSPRPQVAPSEARWHVELVIGRPGETTDTHLYFGGASEPTAADWPGIETDGWEILGTTVNRTPQGIRVGWNTEGYRELIDEIRTNDLDHDTIVDWIIALSAVHYARTGTALDDTTAHATPAVVANAYRDTYPAAMVFDMIDTDDVTDTEVTTDDVAAAFRTMARYAQWHKAAARLPEHPETGRTPGYDAIMAEMMRDDIEHSPWGTYTSWVFAVADVALTVYGEYLPGFRQHRAQTREEIADANMAGMSVLGLVDDGTATYDDLTAVHTVLGEWSERMTAWGLDY